ncbi:MAG: B3/4 domain-containing protein [Gemmatimonadota bacterium]
MELLVRPEVFAAFPGLRIAVAVARGVDNLAPRPAVEAGWRAAWATAGAAAAQHGNAQSHPRILPWRERFRALGVPPKQFPSSAEALLRRAMKGGEPFRISPLVDFYNTVSLRHGLPAGGFDLAQLRGPLELRRTREGDSFQPLEGGSPEPLGAGEIAYADGSVVLTRHFVWRQARTGLIAPSTRDVILVSEALGELPSGAAEAVLADLRGGLRELFDAASGCGIVDERSASFAW